MTYSLASKHLKESTEAIRRVPVITMLEASKVISNSLRIGKKLMICGNGGSAADAQHIAAEFVNKLNVDRRALPALALTTDTSILTANANDYGFKHVFERQIEAFGRSGDVLLAISTSGNSENVLLAVNKSKDKGISTIGLTGGSGGELARTTDKPIIVPSDKTQHIQEAHIVIGHILCELVEKELWDTLTARQ